jgi:hypothetical protein
LEECIEIESDFVEPVQDFQHSRGTALICFVTPDGQTITHLSTARKGITAGTGLRKLRLTDPVILSDPIPAFEILNRLPTRYKRHAQPRLEGGGLLPPKTFKAVVDATTAFDPSLRTTLERFSSAHARLLQQLPTRTKQSLAFQKEALQTALTIANIDRDSLQQWTMVTESKPTSFLDGLPSARLREDPLVVQDLQSFPGFDVIKRLPYNAAVFHSDKVRLTVILANRQPLEQQTGTDLVYFNESFQCFVMVQYKMMQHENGESFFRIPNQQLNTEIDRMEKLYCELQKCEADESADGYRFNNNPFFIKLCSRILFNPDDVGLVPGLYIPLTYWSVLTRTTDLTGPRGGSRITHDNVKRYLDNTSFASLVSKAWVGTTVTQSIILKDIIRGTLESGKAVAVAIENRRTPSMWTEPEPAF